MIAGDQRLVPNPQRIQHMARAESSPREETDLVPLFAILPLKLEVVYRPLATRGGSRVRV